jgi:hypothetical protein
MKTNKQKQQEEEKRIFDDFLGNKKEDVQEIIFGDDSKAEPDLLCEFKNGDRQWYEITTMHYRDEKGKKQVQPKNLQSKINIIAREIKKRFDDKFQQKRRDGRNKYDVKETVNLIVFDETEFDWPVKFAGFFPDGTPVMWATIYQQIAYKLQEDKKGFGCITGEICIMGIIDGKIRKASAKSKLPENDNLSSNPQENA